MKMNHPFNIAVTKEKKEDIQAHLTQKYPRLPVEIIQTAIETCTWYTLFQGTNRYNTQMALDTFAEMASNIVGRTMRTIKRGHRAHYTRSQQVGWLED